MTKLQVLKKLCSGQRSHMSVRLETEICKRPPRVQIPKDQLKYYVKFRPLHEYTNKQRHVKDENNAHEA